MSNAGQAVLTIASTAIGAFLGGPTGAAWGFQIGQTAGSVLFPTDLGTVSGPRLSDLNVQSSAIGAPIPIIFGTYAVSGNVIWSSGLIETVTEQRQGGKGGPTQTVQTYTYRVNCAVGVCEGPISGYRRIWADGKLIYDARPQGETETEASYEERVAANILALQFMTFYLGDEEQEADPTIESFEGIDSVSGFRGLAYVVFNDFQLEEYGNRVPNWRFEVMSRGQRIEVTTVEYSAPVIHPWLGESADPRNPLNNHQYYDVSTSSWTADYEAAWAAFYAFNLTSAEGSSRNPLVEQPLAWSFIDGDNQREAVAPYDFTDDRDADELRIWYAPEVPPNFAPNTDRYAPSPTAALIPDLTYGQFTYHSGTQNPGRGHAIYWFGDLGDEPAYNFPSSEAIGPAGSPPFLLSGQIIISWNDHSFDVRRVPSPPEGEGWELVSGTAKTLNTYNQINGYGYRWVAREYIVRSYQYYKKLFRPSATVLLPADDNYDNEAWWTAQYEASLAEDGVPSGWTYGIDYPQVISEYYRRELVSYDWVYEDGVVDLAHIVSQICLRCGLTAEQIDVSDLTELVGGYVISRVMSGRDAIAPLRPYGLFDCVESGSVLKWPTRGKPAVASLTTDDLAAHVGGDSRPSAVETDRQQEVELPRRLRLHYAKQDLNYEPGEQSASRLAAGADHVADLEIALSMTDTKAAEVADIALYDLWVERNRHRVVVDQSFLALEPADAITAPIDGRQERLRILSIDHSLPGLLRLECVRDDDGVYVSYALPAPSATSGTGGRISTVGVADLVLLDVPLLQDSDNDAGYYAAVRAVGGNSWGGAVLYRSPDAGVTYLNVASMPLEATIGELLEPLPSGPTTIFDNGNSLVIDLPKGALESRAEASVLAGLNAAAIGQDGRWEIIQFSLALNTDGTTWRLYGLLRGRRGTEWAMGLSQAGDRFVLLDEAVVRVPLNVSGIGAARPHKAVLVGTSLAGTDAVEFTAQAVALEPFSVISITGVRDLGGDLTITWVRRGRIGQEMPTGTDIPVSEASELYEIDLLGVDSPETVVRTLSSSSASVTYTATQQAEDFGSPLPDSVAVRIYQLSSSVGRGYPAEATV